MMKNKNWMIAFALLVLLLFVSYVNAGCCQKIDGTCVPVAYSEECIGTYSGLDCEQLLMCQEKCYVFQLAGTNNQSCEWITDATKDYYVSNGPYFSSLYFSILQPGIYNREGCLDVCVSGEVQICPSDGCFPDTGGYYKNCVFYQDCRGPDGVRGGIDCCPSGYECNQAPDGVWRCTTPTCIPEYVCDDIRDCGPGIETGWCNTWRQINVCDRPDIPAPEPGDPVACPAPNLCSELGRCYIDPDTGEKFICWYVEGVGLSLVPAADTESVQGDLEKTMMLCHDNFDNDCDGMIDCDDIGDQGQPDCGLVLASVTEDPNTPYDDNCNGEIDDFPGSHCYNNIRDEGELGIDCGDPENLCGDCCENAYAEVGSYSNGLYYYDIFPPIEDYSFTPEVAETGFNCGGACLNKPYPQRCPIGSGCKTDADCNQDIAGFAGEAEVRCVKEQGSEFGLCSLCIDRDGDGYNSTASIGLCGDVLDCNDNNIQAAVPGDPGCVGVCTDIAVTGLQAKPIRFSPKIRITWLQPSCPIDHIQITKRNPSGSSEFIEVPANQFEYIDTIDQPKSVYKYSVTIFYKDGQTAYSDEVSITSNIDGRDITSGELFCFQPRKEFCVNDARMECDEDNFYSDPPIEVCRDPPAKNKICRGPDVNGDTMCVEIARCDKCNEPFGVFAEGGRTLWKPPGAFGEQNIDCSQVDSCYIDRLNSTVNAYKSCEFVQSCYDYVSKEACEKNKCDVGLTARFGKKCEWLQNPEFAELGAGICRPVNESEWDCHACERLDSLLIGGCSRSNCQLFGECYFANRNIYDVNGIEKPWSCRSKEETGCQFYTNEQDCVNSSSPFSKAGEQQVGGESNVFATWLREDHSDKRVGGSHAFLDRSDDYFNFGTCKWDDVSGCYKDANNKTNSTYGDLEKDCNDYDYLCIWDNTPPTTTLDTNGVVGRDMQMLYHVNEPATTYFCLTRSGFCYPNRTSGDITTAGVFSHIFNMNDGGYWNLWYYSEDYGVYAPHGNLELVKNRTIFVDTLVGPLDFHFSYEPSLVGVDTYVSTLFVTVNASDPNKIMCFFMLHNSSGARMKDQADIQPFEENFTLDLVYPGLKDGIYYLNYTCVDGVGNVLKGRRDTRIDGDLSISNPQPSWTINYNLEDGAIPINITTQNRAVWCKYGFGKDAEPSFLFDTSEDGKFHEKVLTGVNTPTYLRGTNEIVYIRVKCNVTTSRGFKLAGMNTADDIIFAIDKTGPVTEVVDASSNKPAAVSGLFNHPVDLRLKCYDVPITNYGFPDKAFGCANITACINGQCSTLPPVCDEENCLTGGYRQLPTIYDTTTITYYSTDKGGNTGNVTEDVIRVDMQPPEFDFEVLDLDGEVVDIIGTGYHLINVTASDNNGQISSIPSKPKITISSRSGLVPTRNYTLENNMFVSIDPMPDDIETEVEVTVSGYDLADNLGSRTKYYMVDTKKPAPVTFMPAFDTFMKRDAHDPYRYYTNRSWFVSGKTSENNLTITFYIANDEHELINISSYNQKIIVGDNKPISPVVPPVVSPATQASHGVNFYQATGIEGENTIKTNKLVSLDHLQEGNYVLLDVDGFRRDYRHYGWYHKITGVSDVGNNYIVTLETPLTKSFQSPEPFYIYKKEIPEKWFGDETNLALGENIFFANVTDQAGNIGKGQVYVFLVDQEAPVLDFVYPGIGEMINEKNVIFDVRVKDLKKGSRVDQNSIKVLFDGVDVENFTLSAVAGNPNYDVVKISFKKKNLEYGTHNLSVNARDNAGNIIARDWGFEIVDVPAKPIMSFLTIAAGNPYAIDGKETYFLATDSNFTLSFKEDRIKLNNVAVDGSPLDCFNTSLNVFKCELLTSEGSHIINVKAQYYNSSFELSEEGNYNFYVVKDIAAPEFTLDYKSKARPNSTLRITANVLNEEHDVLMFLNFSNHFPRIYQQFYRLDWAVPNLADGSYIFPVTATDHAGNQKTVNMTIEIDQGLPVFNITDVLVHGFNRILRYTVVGTVNYRTNAFFVDILGDIVSEDVNRIIAQNIEDMDNTLREGNITDDRFNITDVNIFSSQGEDKLNQIVVTAIDEIDNRANKTLNIYQDIIGPQNPNVTIIEQVLG
ncbi:hypothetical protein DRJ17_01980 [Candidatus Woesearchaeota archaeon]|nr:MAG: hypothetical protein DRJ17_01980 [Candidatus Woesearchaeota archaeon]